MIRNLIPLFFLIIFPITLTAQILVHGIIKQDNNEVVPLANIRLFSENKNALVVFTTTNIDGAYQLQVKDYGKYWLTVSYIGNKTESKLIEVTLDRTEVNFELKSDMEALSEIIINTKNLDIFQKNDTISYNLSKLTNGTEVSLKDILKKLPGITLENGKIYAQGKIINKVLINGDEFTLNQRTLSETLAAKMIDGIDLLKDYKQNSILTDFNSQQEQALNLKIKKEYWGVFKGELGMGVGLINKYGDRGVAYNLGDKFKVSIIADFNNIGESPISINEFIELKGGILSLFGNRPSPMNNGISLNNSIMPIVNTNASKVNNEFGSFNINYRYSPKIKISSSFLVFNTIFNSWDESISLYKIEDEFLTIWDKNSTQKHTVMEQGNFNLEYRKSPNENIVYVLSQSYSNSNKNVEINTSNFLWEHFFQQSEAQNKFIDQDLSLLKRYSNKFILYSSIHHTFENKKNQDLWISKDEDQKMNQFNDFNRNYFSSEMQLIYKPLKIQYEWNLGIRYNSTTHYTNLVNSLFLQKDISLDIINGLKLNSINSYSNFSLNKKTGVFQFLASLTPSYFYINSKQNNFLLYKFKADFYFTRNNHLDISLQNDFTIIDAQKTFQGLFANSYRTFSISDLAVNTFAVEKKYNFNYYFSKVITGTNVYVNLFYNEIKNGITTSTVSFNDAQYHVSSYVISPLQKKYTANLSIEQRLFDLPFRIRFQGNFNQNNYTSYSQGEVNFLQIKNHKETFSFQSYFKKTFNISGGLHIESTKNISLLWNTTNKLISYKPYLTLECDYNKGYSVNLTSTYNYIANGNSQTEYFNLSPEFKYRMPNLPWEFSLYGDNVLNLNKMQFVSVDFGNNYFQTNKYSRLSGYLLAKVKYFF